ncbi:MAG: phosphatase PAP2 family protein [Bacteroidota bacterium]
MFIQNICISQDSLVTNVKPDLKYLKSYFTDTKDLLIAPVKWNYKEWIVLGGTSLTTLIIINNDKPVYDWFQDNRNTTTDNVSKYGLEPWGSGLYSMPLMGLFYLHGSIYENNRSKNVALNGVKAFLLSGLMVQIPKYLFNRHRPYNGDFPDPYVWDGPFTGKYYKSFFSGHTTTVFSVATVIASEYSDKQLIPVITYTIAGISAVSRINDNKHWASDVFAGAVFGYAIGKLIHNNNKIGVTVYPITSINSNGILIKYSL